jgi:hypothetical protein
MTLCPKLSVACSIGNMQLENRTVMSFKMKAGKAVAII